MAVKKECIAMLLAGGQGSRLYTLTKKLAKPAVPFGGKYRIIDFTLSNCINSGIETVGILTQYQPLKLNTYIGTGQPWDLDRIDGGAFILPPYQRQQGADWYKGTANAIYQNMDFIEGYSPEYVLVLSGDHVYKMDYSLMLSFHKQNKADCTIAVLEVPINEASRFGIMSTDDELRITEFEEKPSHPKSSLASMGIYIFKWEKLKKYLIEDEKNVDSHNDFGKDIIPAMLSKKERLFAYRFKGYWKDVGTIESLWEANMDLLDSKSGINFDDPNFKVYSKNQGLPPHFVGVEGKIENSIVAEGCEVYGTVENSILFLGVKVERGAFIKDSIVMHDTVIKRDSMVCKSILAENVTVGRDSYIGKKVISEVAGSKVTVIGEGNVIKDGTVIYAGDILD